MPSKSWSRRIYETVIIHYRMTIKQQFKRSIKCGTGEAYFILKKNPTRNFSKIILDAAKNNYAYDGQSEGNRAEYIVRLIDLCNQKEEIESELIKELNLAIDNTWDVDQLFGINAIFAKRGNDKAKKAIYKRYRKNKFESDWLGQEEIVHLDGLDGLKIIVETRGKSLEKNKDDWEDSFFIDWFQEENPKLEVYKELKKTARRNKFIKKYLQTILKSKKKSKTRTKRVRITYKQVAQNIDQIKTVPISPRGIRELTQLEIEKLANDFLAESNPLKQEKYLRIFSRRKYPLEYNPILAIAKGKNKKNTRLVEFACESLKYFQGKDIRKFALEKLKATNRPSDYLYLLVSNYKKGDAKLLYTIVAKYRNQDVIHSLVYGLIEIYKNNDVTECRKRLELIYNKMTCGIHRHELLEILYKNKALSKKILKEIEFDSFEITNKLYHDIKTDDNT